MSRKRSSGIYLLADTGDCMKIILVDSFGWKTCLSGKPPAEALVDFVNFDFSAYRASVERLWNEHDVFADRPKVPYSDYEDFERQAVPLAQQIRETAPIAHWDVFHHIEQARTMKDDGRPIFASRKAHSVLTALRGPYFLQNRMKNIFEIAFADFERGTQQQRFRALEDVWPGLVDRAFPIRLLPEGEESDLKGQVKEYTLTDLFEFCLAELSLYFQQSRQRIARCENCWRYFVPKTEAQSRYCYGEVDGIPCKDAGPKHMRRFRADTDETLAVYERLRRRLEERANRLEIAGPGNHLRSFSRSQYEEWLDMAKAAKKSYRVSCPRRNFCVPLTGMEIWLPTRCAGSTCRRSTGRRGGAISNGTWTLCRRACSWIWPTSTWGRRLRRGRSFRPRSKCFGHTAGTRASITATEQESMWIRAYTRTFWTGRFHSRN